MPRNPAIELNLGASRPPFPPSSEPPAAAPTATPAPNGPTSSPSTSSSGLTPPADRSAAEEWLKGELRRLSDELGQTKETLAANQSELEQARASAAATRLAPTKGSPGVKVESQGQSNMRLSRAQNAAGGVARYRQLALPERLALLGFQPPSQQDIDDAPRYFGRQSSASQAQGLARTHPVRYSFLRHLARELGVK